MLVDGEGWWPAAALGCWTLDWGGWASHGGVMVEAVGQVVDCFDVGVFFGGLAVVHVEILLGVTLLSTMLVLEYGVMRDVFFISFLVAMALPALVAACLGRWQLGLGS
jgi:hypothetical protein